MSLMIVQFAICFDFRNKIHTFNLCSANGNGHYASQSMQQTQSPYMGVNNMPGNAYNKNQYNSGPHMQRAPIYDGKSVVTTFLNPIKIV